RKKSFGAWHTCRPLRRAVDLQLRRHPVPETNDLLPASSFRFAQRTARVATDDGVFRERFLRLFFDCLEPRVGAAEGPPVELEVSSANSPDSVAATISEHPEDVDLTVLEMLFPMAARAQAGATSLRGIAVGRGTVVVSTQLPWRLLIAHYFVHHVMRLQTDMLFLHGASAVIRGQGTFLGGDKGAGKSTLALA